MPQILSRGSGPDWARSTWLTWGALSRATGQSGVYHPGDLAKREAANSSTMRGPQGLASELPGRRCRTVKTRSRRVRGSFYVLPPEIASRWLAETMPARKGGHTAAVSSG